jgi:hypothetical protein
MRYGIALFLLSLPACGTAVKSGTCETDGTCSQAHPTTSDPTWGCVGQSAAPDPSKMVNVKLTFVDAVTLAPISQASARVCAIYDVSCDVPVQMPALSPTGELAITLPETFQGYLQLSSPDHVAHVVMLDPVATTDEQIEVLSEPLLTGIAKQAGMTYDPAQGTVLLRTVDCARALTAGESVSLSPSPGQTAYFTDGLPSTSGTATDATGVAMVLNVAPGLTTVSATLASNAQVVATRKGLVRPNTITIVDVAP